MGKSNDAEQFLIKKAYELCYALVRTASHAQRDGFARRLEDCGFALLEATASGDYKKALSSADASAWLLKLGSDIGIVHPSTVSLINSELTHFNSIVAEFGNAAKAGEVNLTGVFSGFPAVVNQDANTGGIAAPSAPRARENSSLNGSDLENGNGHSVAKAAMRQSAILDRIRQSGNLPDGAAGCRLKELQEVLPDVSERTIRYDIQRLLEQGLVERIGNGGPATGYKLSG